MREKERRKREVSFWKWKKKGRDPGYVSLQYHTAHYFPFPYPFSFPIISSLPLINMEKKWERKEERYGKVKRIMGCMILKKTEIISYLGDSNLKGGLSISFISLSQRACPCHMRRCAER